jgi:Flp pilus assembly pilin Flp
MEKTKTFLKDESGMETLEYAVTAGLIAAVAIIVYASGWGTALRDRPTPPPPLAEAELRS